MEYTTLGNTGLEVSRLCFGTWRFELEAGDGTVETTHTEAHDLLDAVESAGINFIDTANAYGDGDAERWIGEWLADRDREDYVIASKVYWTQVSRPSETLSRKTIRAEIEGTLDRLDTDYIDLYYIHRWDDDTPIRETLSALNGLIRDGKVHYLGASSMAAWKLMKAVWQADVHDWERFDVTQPRFNAVYREPVADYLDVCADQDLAVCPYSPLEGGFLTGKYERDDDTPSGSRGDLHGWDDRWDDRQWATLEVIREIADAEDATPAQVSLRWMMDIERFTCVPIVGARTVDQVADNAGAVAVDLSAEQRDRITAASEGK